MAKKSLLEKLEDYYNGENKDILSPLEKKRKKRIDFIIEIKLFDFASSDKNIIAKVKNNFQASSSTILSEISIAERVIAMQKSNTPDAQKAWMRYMIYQGALEAYRIAREKNDSYSMIQAMNIIGKHHNTDKEDVYADIFDQIVPFIPTISSDPSVIGIKPIKNIEKIKLQLKQKYTTTDIDYEEIIPEKEKNISE